MLGPLCECLVPLLDGFFLYDKGSEPAGCKEHSGQPEIYDYCIKSPGSVKRAGEWGELIRILGYRGSFHKEMNVWCLVHEDSDFTPINPPPLKAIHRDPAAAYKKCMFRRALQGDRVANLQVMYRKQQNTMNKNRIGIYNI